MGVVRAARRVLSAATSRRSRGAGRVRAERARAEAESFLRERRQIARAALEVRDHGDDGL